MRTNEYDLDGAAYGYGIYNNDKCYSKYYIEEKKKKILFKTY